ncbi:hypothetical protein C5Y41_09600 [Rahnella variigena]|nr:hypothetical protein C5Y41_09600 [Rahnella variigena]
MVLSRLQPQSVIFPVPLLMISSVMANVFQVFKAISACTYDAEVIEAVVKDIINDAGNQVFDDTLCI